MKRYKGFDPPEYLDWRPDPALVRAYADRLEADPERLAVVAGLGEDELIALHAGMVRNRLHDYALKRWVRQGVISKAWLGTGEEATTIGAVHALVPGRDVVAPMIRNAGACHEFGMPLDDMLRGYLATPDGPNGGRDGHVGAPALGVLAPISPVGEMVAVVAGVALAFVRRGEPRVALTWVGDGTTKTGLFHEGVSFAAAQHVPAIFVVQNNQVALGTRLDQHQRGDFRDWPKLYGVPGAWADGNNVLDVYAAVKLAADRLRATPTDGPFLLVVDTFRMGGHATHDEAEARATFAPELFREWGARDPIGLYEEYLVARGIDRARLADMEEAIIAEVDAAAERALASRQSPAGDGAAAEYPGFSAGVRQPGLARRLEKR